jgi:hypothetical protein
MMHTPAVRVIVFLIFSALYFVWTGIMLHKNEPSYRIIVKQVVVLFVVWLLLHLIWGVT